jgi:cation-transporting ATPase E
MNLIARLPQEERGLTSAEVAERIARGETNAFKVQVGRTYWEIFRDNLFNVFNFVLATLGAIMIFFQDYLNLLFASFSVVLNSILGLVQEIAAKRALDRLAALSMQQVKVWRDGKLSEVPLSDVVKDDLLPLEAGDKIAVDGVVLAADSLEVNEALLTGESDAVLKEVGAKLYSGSFVIAGAGVMRATAVGAESTINKLSATAKAYRHPLTPTQRYIANLVQIAVFVMLIFAPMTIIGGLVMHLPTIEIVRNAVVLVTSMVPQGLVLVTTISLSIGALLISRRRTLVQRINAVESMANVNVLCFDKTGTLTRNALSVTEVIPLNGAQPEALHSDLRRYVANLATQNRTAGAIAAYVGANGGGAVKQREIPFTSARKWGAVIFEDETLILGAPERVLDPERDAEALQVALERSKQGERVIAFARSPEVPTDSALPEARRALALIAMSDQIRPEVRQTIEQFRALGVELKVISGDNAETVRAIAQQAGMAVRGVYTGDQLEAMDAAAFAHAVREANLFARVEPETKRKIVRALKAQGAYVAMVGDGVNDVPALKEANLAIAMNDGAQIAKDVADLVLLDNSMATLPNAFERGKTITQKIFGSTRIFLTKNFYTVLAFIFVGFMALPFATTPILISWLTFGMVNVPGILITFGFLRPRYLASFPNDVMRYVLTATVVGGLSMSVLYAACYLLLRGDVEVGVIELAARDEARSGLLVFMALFCLVVFWNTFGVELFKVQSLREHPRLVALGIGLVLLTLVPPYFLPQLFQGWSNPRFLVFAAAALSAGVAAMVMHWLYHDRQLEKLLPLGANGG